MKLSLTLACNVYDRTFALLTGAVAPEGIDLNVVVLEPGELFRRQARHAEFDVAEFSVSTHTILQAQGDRRLVGLPVFLSRRFRHSDFYVSTAAGIRAPHDLLGKRIGVMEYQATAMVWQRGVLHHEYGVPADQVEWLFGAYDRPGTFEERIPITLPERFRTRVIPSSESLDGLLARGEIEALIGTHPPRSVRAGTGAVARLFPNYQEVEVEYYRRTGIFPLMHMVVMKREVYERAPWIAMSLYKAFVQAKQVGYERLREVGPSVSMLPWLHQHLEEADALLGPNPYAYGLQANRPVVEAFVQYSHEQGLIDRPLAVEDLFAAETLDTADAEAATH
ncbi:MAG TPA: ABC transporter substrate-binding protein [Chloroflexota bacterium]|nr:ABC transporter substrate-binding protein [Chloroflexota bacterium]